MVTGPDRFADFAPDGAGAVGGGWAAPADGTTLRRNSSESVGVESPARPENSPPAPNNRLTVAATSDARACLRRMTNSWTLPTPWPPPPGGSPAPPTPALGGTGREGPIRKKLESSV